GFWLAYTITNDCLFFYIIQSSCVSAYLSQKSGKIELDLEQTESLTANIEMQLDKITIGRGY
ncbi:hypothetical protein QUA05_05455, partial [Microcoleus sp. SVA1_A1]